MLKFFAAAIALLTPLAHAQLQARDIDQNGTVDAFYDAQQNISFLADANIYATLGGALNTSPFGAWGTPTYLAPGELRLQNAFNFLDGLVVAGLDGWRMPQRLIPAGDPTGTNHQCSATACNPGAFWATELTTMLAGQSDLSIFANVQAGDYMSGVSFWQGTGYAQYVTLSNPTTGHEFVTDETGLVWGYVWAVHDGDVGVPTHATIAAPVPEPETYALMLTAIASLGVAQSRRRYKPGPRPA